MSYGSVPTRWLTIRRGMWDILPVGTPPYLVLQWFWTDDAQFEIDYLASNSPFPQRCRMGRDWSTLITDEEHKYKVFRLDDQFIRVSQVESLFKCALMYEPSRFHWLVHPIGQIDIEAAAAKLKAELDKARQNIDNENDSDARQNIQNGTAILTTILMAIRVAAMFAK